MAIYAILDPKVSVLPIWVMFFLTTQTDILHPPSSAHLGGGAAVLLTSGGYYPVV